MRGDEARMAWAESSPAQRGRRVCGAGCKASPRGQFICPEGLKSEGPPKHTGYVLGSEANACGFKKGDRGMLIAPKGPAVI